MSHVTLYVTASSADEAGRIARALVEERLAACANIIDGVRSIYWWDGAVHDDAEAIVIAKTRAELAGKAIARVKDLHSYRVPCITVTPIAEGNPDFLAWIDGETYHPVAKA